MRIPAQLRHQAFDAVVAGGLLVASVLDVFTHALQGVYPHSAWAHLPFAVATSVPLFVRRTRPLTALIAVAVLQSAWIYSLYPLDQQPPLVPFVQALIVVYSAAAYAEGRAAQAAWLVLAVGIATDIPSLAIGKPAGYVAGPDLSLAVAFGVGLGLARMRHRAEAQEQRAALAERTQLEAVERAASEERARIARELHDVISHDVSLMVLQASVERRVRDGEDSANRTLASIETTGREALVELRRMLGVLRKDDSAAPLQPQPGLAQLPDLIVQVRAAGVPVELVIYGDPVPLPPGLDIAAYRIVQESLTNVVKHAAGARVTATVRYGDGRLELKVVNAGAARAGFDAHLVAATRAAGGHGLVGMQERVALFGGTIEAAPTGGGGFQVRARLPLPA